VYRACPAKGLYLFPQENSMSDRDDRIELAYWEMEARIDPTQPHHHSVGRHEAFVRAINNLLDHVEISADQAENPTQHLPSKAD
jgi:hypothetical protein